MVLFFFFNLCGKRVCKVVSRCCISQLPAFLHLGNKCDLEQERQVQFEEACNLANEMGVLAALETSAKVTSVLTHMKSTEKFKLELLSKVSVSLSASRRVRTWKKPS